MNKPRTTIGSRALLISLLVVGVLAYAGASGAGPLGLIVASDDPVIVADDDCTEERDGTVGEDPDAEAGEDLDAENPDAENPDAENPEGEDPEDCQPAEDPEGEDPQDEETPVDPESREGECSEAAGLVDEEGNAGSVDDVYGEINAPFGQTHSMEVLLVNCMKNPQAKGLLRALENHARHLERWEARAEMRAEREVAKAERKAAREAAKAERKAARAAAKAAHGHGGGHGKGHGH